MNRSLSVKGEALMNKKRSRKWRICAVIIVSIITVFTIAGAIYVNDYYRADNIALDALLSDEMVSVEQIEDHVVAFVPEEPTAGLIFYPGGKVEYTAYAPLLHGLAEKGVLCLLCRMPCNLAVLDIDAAEGLQEKFPEVGNWYIGGHSLGGSMAAAYVWEHTDDYKGLILLAAYSTKDISQSGLQVLSVYGSQDGVLDIEKYTENLTNLPADLKEYVIKDGCHAQFGSYGRQEGDGTPGISGEEQREAAIDYIMELIENY